jgi:predicted O-methyltransferase YrrM
MNKRLFDDATLALYQLIDLAWLYIRHQNNELIYYNLLSSIVLAANPTTIVELGTGPGLSSLAFIRALQHRYRTSKVFRGRLHTCDIDAVPLRRLRRFGSIVVPHLMTTDELAVRWSEWDLPIDLLYIDADHSQEQSLADFQHFSPYVVPNGIIMMHDTFPLSEKHEQLRYSGTVWKTAQFIKKHYAEEFEIMTFPHLCGISFLRKKGAKYF